MRLEGIPECVAKRPRQRAGDARGVSSPDAGHGRRQLAAEHRLCESVGRRDELQIGLTAQGHIQIDIDGRGKSVRPGIRATPPPLPMHSRKYGSRSSPPTSQASWGSRQGCHIIPAARTRCRSRRRGQFRGKARAPWSPPRNQVAGCLIRLSPWSAPHHCLRSPKRGCPQLRMRGIVCRAATTCNSGHRKPQKSVANEAQPGLFRPDECMSGMLSCLNRIARKSAGN